MTCDEARQRLIAGDVAPAVEEHLAHCASCREERARIAAFERAMAGGLHALAEEAPEPAVEEMIAAVQHAGRRVSLWRRVGFAMAATVLVAASAYLCGVVSTLRAENVHLRCELAAARLDQDRLEQLRRTTAADLQSVRKELSRLAANMGTGVVPYRPLAVLVERRPQRQHALPVWHRPDLDSALPELQQSVQNGGI